NLSQREGTIDVHGLRPLEALEQVETALYSAVCSGKTELRVIVGRGLHSRGRVPVLRPRIMEEMLRQDIPCRTLSRNSGVLVLTVP
ncbi:hypothetical protein C8J57DRAFT_1050148, partial [Mycena rebaudengoi]